VSTTLSSRELPETFSVDRRAFLGTAGLAAGAVLASASVPGLCVALGPTPASSDAASSSQQSLPDDSWHIDDMCGHRLRYAHPIPSLHAQSQLAMLGPVEPVDRALVV
jgi:hypothetical protein